MYRLLSIMVFVATISCFIFCGAAIAAALNGYWWAVVVWLCASVLATLALIATVYIMKKQDEDNG